MLSIKFLHRLTMNWISKYCWKRLTGWLVVDRPLDDETNLAHYLINLLQLLNNSWLVHQWISSSLIITVSSSLNESVGDKLDVDIGEEEDSWGSCWSGNVAAEDELDLVFLVVPARELRWVGRGCKWTPVYETI